MSAKLWTLSSAFTLWLDPNCTKQSNKNNFILKVQKREAFNSDLPHWSHFQIKPSQHCYFCFARSCLNLTAGNIPKIWATPISFQHFCCKAQDLLVRAHQEAFLNRIKSGRKNDPGALTCYTALQVLIKLHITTITVMQRRLNSVTRHWSTARKSAKHKENEWGSAGRRWVHNAVI